MQAKKTIPNACRSSGNRWMMHKIQMFKEGIRDSHTAQAAPAKDSANTPQQEATLTARKASPRLCTGANTISKGRAHRWHTLCTIFGARERRENPRECDSDTPLPRPKYKTQEHLKVRPTAGNPPSQRTR